MRSGSVLLAAAVFMGAVEAAAAMRPTPEYLKRAVVYQVVLRNFTRDGNFKTFNDRAHSLAMKVFMDLVYLHCGPNNVAANLTGKPTDGGKDVGSLAAYSYVIRDVK